MNNVSPTGLVSRRTLISTIALSVVAANIAPQFASATDTPMPAPAAQPRLKYGRGYGGGYK